MAFVFGVKCGFAASEVIADFGNSPPISNLILRQFYGLTHDDPLCFRKGRLSIYTNFAPTHRYETVSVGDKAKKIRFVTVVTLSPVTASIIRYCSQNLNLGVDMGVS